MTRPRIETIELTRGDDFSATVTFDQPVSGFAEMRFTIRETWATREADNDTATFTTLLTPSGTYTADFDIPHASAVAFEFSEYVHDIEVVTNAGKRYTTQRGPVLIAPDASR
jgi:hypothetical protein